ncbi:hypothetical protein EBZ38_16520 [bacterium]|nr:hypothetical protein [bacterium]
MCGSVYLARVPNNGNEANNAKAEPRQPNTPTRAPLLIHQLPIKGTSLHVSAPSLALCTNCEGSFPLTTDMHIKLLETEPVCPLRVIGQLGSNEHQPAWYTLFFLI